MTNNTYHQTPDHLMLGRRAAYLKVALKHEYRYHNLDIEVEYYPLKWVDEEHSELGTIEARFNDGIPIVMPASVPLERMIDRVLDAMRNDN